MEMESDGDGHLICCSQLRSRMQLSTICPHRENASQGRSINRRWYNIRVVGGVGWYDGRRPRQFGSSTNYTHSISEFTVLVLSVIDAAPHISAS